MKSTETALRKVLVIEDDEAMQRFYAAFFGKQHSDEFRWSLARDAEQGLAALKSETWDLAIVDWTLPGPLSGLSVVRALRAQPSTRGLGVIVVTGRATPSDAVTALDSGADDYLAKPVDGTLFLARLRSVMRRAGQRRRR